MVVIRISSCSANDDGSQDTWRAQVSKGAEATVVDIPSPSEQDRNDLDWYLEDYVHHPFEASRAAKVKSFIREHGARLAIAIASTNLISRKDTVELEVDLGPNLCNKADASFSGCALHPIALLHWEILEDTSLWPEILRLVTVNVKRTLRIQPSVGLSRVQDGDNGNVFDEVSAFNILLVISRPKGREDLEYQLVSRYLVECLDRVRQEADVKVVLTILRPPTWQAFQNHLLKEVPEGHYQLVHFDMAGQLMHSQRGETGVSLAFDHLINAQEELGTQDHLHSAHDIASVLNQARVSCVITNFCDAASAHHKAMAGILAEVFVRSGITFVLAMSYQIVDKAVELFMGSFYHSLIIQGIDVGQSVHGARQALMKSPTRTGHFLQNLDMLDYFVPAYYQISDASLLRISPEKNPRGLFSKIKAHAVLPTLSAGSKPRSLSLGWQDSESPKLGAVPEAPHRRSLWSRKKSVADPKVELVGRDHTILEMEGTLKRCGRLLLHGPGGCGKTFLLEYCQTWWKRTALVEQSYCFDFAKSTDTIVKFEDILNDMGKALALHSNSWDGVLSGLRGSSTLLVFDSVESLDAPGLWQKAQFAAEDLDKLWDFLDQVCHDNVYVVLCSRTESLPRIDRLAGLAPYPICGLSVLGSASLAGQLIRLKSPLTASVLDSQEGVDYLGRISILLEGNPDALLSVLPTLWNSAMGLSSTKDLFHLLLVGICPLDPQISQTSRMFKTIRSVLAWLEIVSTVHRNTLASVPQVLFPFWNTIPRELLTYCYLLHSQINKKKKEPPFSFYYTDIYRDIVLPAFDTTTKTSECLRTTIDTLTKAGVIQDAEATLETSTELNAMYHVHPLFTLLARNLVPKTLYRAGHYAFIMNQVIGLKEANGSNENPRIMNFFWNHEEQHVDHVTNNQVEALSLSLDGDMESEVDCHGLTLADALFYAVMDAFYHNRRLGELVKPLVARQLNRVTKYAVIRRSHRLSDSRYIVSSLMRYTKLSVRGKVDSASLLLIQIALNAGSKSRSDGQKEWFPDMDQSWYELHLRENQIYAADNPKKARSQLGKVLQTDPHMPESDALWMVTRRVVVQLLMLWIECAMRTVRSGRGADRNFDQNVVDINGARALVDAVFDGELANISEILSSRPDMAALSEMSLKQLIGPAFGKAFREKLTQFGRLATRIFDEPMDRNFAVATDKRFAYYTRYMVKSASLDVPDVAKTDHHPRTSRGDGPSSRLVMDRILAHQSAPSSATSKDSAQLHERLYSEAAGQKDWHKAIQHLHIMRDLSCGQPPCTDDEAGLLMRYAMSYNELGNAEECARAVISLGGLPDVGKKTSMMSGILEFKSFESALSSRSKLHTWEKVKLSHIIKQARSDRKEFKRISENLKEVTRLLQNVMDTDQAKIDRSDSQAGDSTSPHEENSQTDEYTVLEEDHPGSQADEDTSAHEDVSHLQTSGDIAPQKDTHDSQPNNDTAPQKSLPTCPAPALASAPPAPPRTGSQTNDNTAPTVAVDCRPGDAAEVPGAWPSARPLSLQVHT